MSSDKDDCLGRPVSPALAGGGNLPPLSWLEKKRKYEAGKWKAPVPPVDARWVHDHHMGEDGVDRWIMWIDNKGEWL